MSRKSHPSDTADREAVGRATEFNVHLRRSPSDKINKPAKTLAKAIEIADRLELDYPGKKALIYAITPEDGSVPVPKDIQDAARTGKAASEKVAGDHKASLKGDVAAKLKTAAVGKRQAAIDAAKEGALPSVPDFSAPTHARFRKKLDQVVEMVKAGDIAGLKAFEINPASTSPKAIARYRDLAVIAFEAKAEV